MAILSSLFGAQQQQPAVGAQPITTTEIPKQLAPYYEDILSKAQALYNKRVEEGFKPYEGPTIAQFTPEQEATFAGIAGLQGQVAPKFAEAEQLTRDAAAQITGEQIQEAMSPYQQAVTDIEKRESQKAFEQNVLPKLRAAQVAQGSFGGTRGTLLEAQAIADQQRALADIQAKGSAAAFKDARAALEAERTRMGQGATQLANIAPTALKTGLAELGAQQTVGETKQRQAQTALDEAYRQFLQEKQEPYEAMQKYQAVVTGAPLTTTQFAPPPAPGPSLGQQLIGGLAGIGSLYGTFTGKPVFGQATQSKTGGGIAGLVKRQGGGTAYDSFMATRKPITFPTVDSGTTGGEALRGSIGSLIETLQRQGVSNTEIGNLLNEQIKKDRAALVDPQVAKEQAAFKAIQDTIYNPEITEAGSTGRQILAALGTTGVEVGEQVKKAKEKTRADERAIAEKEAALVKGMAADDVTAATTAVAASEKLAEIDAKQAAALAKQNKLFVPDDIKEIKDAVNTVASFLEDENQAAMLNQNSPVQIIDPDGNVIKTAKIPDIHNQAILDATQQLYDLAKDPVLFRRRGANADQVFDSLYNDAIRNILGGGTIRIGVSMAGGGSTTGTSSLGTSQGASGLLPNKSQAKKIINQPT